MKPSDIFGIIVRVTGFLIAIWGIWNVWAGVETFMEVAAHISQPSEQYSGWTYLAWAFRQWRLEQFVFSLLTGLSDWHTETDELTCA